MAKDDKPPEDFERKTAFLSLVAALEDHLVRRDVHSLLSSYSQLPKTDLVMKRGELLGELTELLGFEAGTLLFNILNFTAPHTANLKRVLPDAQKRSILQDIVMKFGPFYAGFITNYLDDWTRADIKANYDYSNQIPSLSVKLLKNSGETIFFESVLSNLVYLLGLMTAQMRVSLDNTGALPYRTYIQSQLTMVRDNVNGMIDRLEAMKEV